MYIYKHKWQNILIYIIYVHIKLLHIIININININFIYKINLLKTKTSYTGCLILNNMYIKISRKL